MSINVQFRGEIEYIDKKLMMRVSVYSQCLTHTAVWAICIRMRTQYMHTQRLKAQTLN